MSEILISLKEISKKYGKKEVLKHLNLEISKGDFVSVIGKSGAGKSTLLNILALFEDYDSGEYIFEGKDISKQDMFKSKIRNEKIGFIFQNYNLIPGLSVEENILLPIAYHKDIIFDYNNIMSKLDTLLNFLEIKDLKNNDISILSGGEQQRVAIARALINEPKIIFADEPTGNLDEITKIKVVDLLKRINKDYQTAIVIVTHDSYVANSTNKKYKLDYGKLELEVSHE